MSVAYGYAFCSIFFTYWTHANIALPLWLEKSLALVLVTPNMHKFHHHFKRPWTDSNFGNIFSFWDRIFGTYIDERDDLKPVYGTVKPLKTFNPLWANIEVFYQMILDSYRTKKFKDKIVL